MAMSVTKIPILRTATIRSFASCPPQPIGGNVNYEIKNTTLPNKLIVASAENESPISRISIVFRVGSRNETHDNAGVSHTLRMCAGLSTKNASQFAITRQIQQVGANLTCTSDRETIAYTLEGTRGAIEKTLPFLTEVATQQIFRPWEVSETVPRQRFELAIRSPQFRAIDLLHKAAFRAKGLGNSLFSAKYRLGQNSAETLQHYVASNFKSGRAAVVGLGVDHADLVKYAEKLQLELGTGRDVASAYIGGEARSDKGGDLAFIALGGQGGAYKDPKQVLIYAVLQKALGGDPQVKWGNNNGVLGKALGNADDQAAINTFSASYSDAGLFGVLVAVSGAKAGKIVEGVTKNLKEGSSLSDADVTRGKNQLKRQVLSDFENGAYAIESIGNYAVLTGSGKSPSQIVADIDTITEDEVKTALKQVGSKGLSIASYGNLSNVPFLDQLK